MLQILYRIKRNFLLFVLINFSSVFALPLLISLNLEGPGDLTVNSDTVVVWSVIEVSIMLLICWINFYIKCGLFFAARRQMY